MTVDTMGPPARPPVRMGLQAKLEYARALAVAELLPEHFRKRPGNVLWAMEYAEALNLPAIAAITGIHVIEGKPGPSAGMMAALVRRGGHRLRVGYTGPSEGARWGTGWAEIVRKDDPEFTFRAEWTVERAVQAEICQIKDGKIFHRTKKGNAGNWQKFYIQMMKARALSEVSRDGAEELLMGMLYTAEELGADLDEFGEPVTPAATTLPAGPWARPSTARPVSEHAAESRSTVDTANSDGDTVDAEVVDPVVEAANAAAAAGGSEGDVARAALDAMADETFGAPDPDDPMAQPGSIQKRTLNALMALFTEAKLGGKSEANRSKRLRVSEIISGMQLTSSNDLSEYKALVIEETLRTAGDEVEQYCADLLRQDDEERAADAAAGEGDNDG